MKPDKYQKAAILETGNCLLLAGAGSGKTFTIVEKINYLVTSNICTSSEILVISFTNKSVNDLKKKIKYPCQIFTFHKLALHILKMYNQNFSLAPSNLLDYVAKEVFLSLSETKLQEELKSYFHVKTYNQIFASKDFKDFQKIIITTIKLLKTTNTSKDILKSSYKENSILTKYALIIQKIYETELKSCGKKDLDDIIIDASNILDKNLGYKYIIIDEFQDTSPIRFNLIYKIFSLSKAKIFAVGDDYQSIYHFTGCNLDIFLNFPKLIPNTKVLKLETTYRFSQNLIDIVTKFITKNPKQLGKNIKSPSQLSNPIEFIYYLNSHKAFEKIYQKLKKEKQSFFVLGRNTFDIKNFTSRPIPEFLTVHSSKGLEAKNVIIINLSNNKNGFPSQVVNHKILEILHPSDTSYLYAEERRLFYVALTRTQNKVYLLVPYFKKSIFIKELKKIIKSL